MLAARLHGPRDLRIETVPEPGDPGEGQVKIKVTAVGVCGSDLHNYLDARIGDTKIASPVVLGHEFAGVVIAVGERAHDGNDQPLKVGQRVAVDPAVPCGRCEMCEAGHPNLCRRLHFCGLYPDDGALQEQMIVAAHSCFPVPDSISDTEAALLEPLGVALHAVDLGKLKLARSVSIIGSGPIGLLITRLAHLSGADPIYTFDCFPWRTAKAKAMGATHAWTVSKEVDAVKVIQDVTDGRGVDVSFEAAWADHSIAQAAEMARLGGRLVLVGIPSDDQINMKHSTARRKGLSIMMSRRMKHTYPRTIQLVTTSPEPIHLDEIVSHHFPLAQADKAFALNVDYAENVHKIVIDI
ncbi:MAG TPA: alcohol dehydrogenase catalytic domain-containing protein [Phototrophicaceae bacterium]|nr:alcohol dehydrogenase catalytic domain-containing protein [Phototrophicaceae bacterium]